MPPFSVRRGPGRPNTVIITRRPLTRPALSKSAGLVTPLLHSIDVRVSPLLPNTKEKRGRTDVPPARRPVRSDATTNARVRRSRASHRRQAISYRLSFCLQSAWPHFKFSNRPFASLRLCDFALKKDASPRAQTNPPPQRTPIPSAQRRRSTPLKPPSAPTPQPAPRAPKSRRG